MVTRAPEKANYPILFPLLPFCGDKPKRREMIGSKSAFASIFSPRKLNSKLSGRKAVKKRERRTPGDLKL